MKRTLAALFLKKYDPPLLVFFWGVLDMKYTVALLKKSETSILFDANPILRTVTVHAQISKIFFLLKWLMMSNHTRTPLTTLLLHYILHHIVYMIYYVVYIRSETRGPNFTCRWICLDVSTHNTQVGNGLPWWSPAWRPTVRHIENWKILSGP